MGTTAAAKKKSKAMKIVLATLRTFSKAKDFYLMSMEQFGSGVAGNPNPQASTLARSLSVSSAKKATKVPDPAGLPRSMSESRSKPNYGVGSYVHNNKTNHNKGLGYGHEKEMKRSCSVAEKNTMMKRIDEDGSCSFREDDGTSHLLYPRSKSYSAKKSTSYMKLRLY